MRILITRHGETEENKLGIVQGHLPGILSKEGKEQARKLAERLRGEKIDLIVSSDLARAADTAKEVAKFHHCEVLFDERLRERFLGKFQGKDKDKLVDSSGNLIAIEKLGKEVEQDDSIFARIKDLLEEITKLGHENILLVGHMGVGKFILATLGKDMGLVNTKLKNTSLSVFEDTGSGINLKLLNCARHLDED